MPFGLTQCSWHYIQCIKDKKNHRGRLVLYDFHGLTVTKALVKLFRYGETQPGRDKGFLDALTETFTNLIHGGKGEWILFIEQGSDRPVPFQYKKDDWLYAY